MVKNTPGNAGDIRDKKKWGLIPGSGRSTGGGQGNPLQCSPLENSTDRGDWQATVHRVAQTLATSLSCSQIPCPKLLGHTYSTPDLSRC